MKSNTIVPVSIEIADALVNKINHKTKPVGALGMLEELALKIGKIQNTLNPKLSNPHILVFAADHGIANEGVSAYPQEVTFQMIYNFLKGGAAINVFSRDNDINIEVIDAGVAHDFNKIKGLRDCKVGWGTKSFLHGAAMNQKELEQCFDFGKAIVTDLQSKGCNVVGFGEMGIGNTSSASMLMSYFCQLPLSDCIGRGTGLNDERLFEKLKILESSKRALNEADPIAVLKEYGGFEIAQMTSAMLTAAANGMIILVDGFIASAAFLTAFKISPNIRDYAVFCHQSKESGHLKMLNYIQEKPLLDIGLRLGEGTGCAVAYPLLKNAVSFLNDMSSFESAGVSEKNVK